MLDCQCKKQLGNWELGQLKHNKKTPTLLPTDGVTKRKRPQPPQENYDVFPHMFQTLYFEEMEEDEEVLSQPPVLIQNYISFGV